MPYIVSFVKPVTIIDREQYINDCCVGGDVVLEQLLPSCIHDTQELEALRELVLSRLREWTVTGLEVERVNERYMPA